MSSAACPRAQTYMRGYKVSLGEVEAALLECKGVEAAVALITEDLTGVQRLVVRPSGVSSLGDVSSR